MRQFRSQSILASITPLKMSVALFLQYHIQFTSNLAITIIAHLTLAQNASRNTKCQARRDWDALYDVQCPVGVSPRNAQYFAMVRIPVS